MKPSECKKIEYFYCSGQKHLEMNRYTDLEKASSSSGSCLKSTDWTGIFCWLIILLVAGFIVGSASLVAGYFGLFNGCNNPISTFPCTANVVINVLLVSGLGLIIVLFILGGICLGMQMLMNSPNPSSRMEML